MYIFIYFLCEDYTIALNQRLQYNIIALFIKMNDSHTNFVLDFNSHKNE